MTKEAKKLRQMFFNITLVPLAYNNVPPSRGPEKTVGMEKEELIAAIITSGHK